MTDLDQLIESTIAVFKPYGKLMPSFEVKYYKRPPLKLLALTVGALNVSKGFGKGVFTKDQLQGILPEREDKLNFFKKLKEYTQICIGESIDVDCNSITSGKEVEKTLLFMQSMARAAENPVVSFDEAALILKNGPKKEEKSRPGQTTSVRSSPSIGSSKAGEIDELRSKINELQKQLKGSSSVYMRQIRFLESRLSKYEKVDPFDAEKVTAHKGSDKSKNGNENSNFFIGEDDEDHHKILKKIGEGATSIAYKIIDERTSKVMCKKVVKEVDSGQAFKKLQDSMKEFTALASIDHPSVCKAIGMNSQEKITGLNGHEDNDKTTIALFLEYLPFKLKDVIKSDIMNNTLKVKIALEVAFGMHHIHLSGMIHRDLKIENIMLNYILEAKIIDFDLVHIDDEEQDSLTKGIGTLDYMSPEMLDKKDYDNKTDVYSYGIVLFVLLTGSLPKQKMTDKMSRKPIQFPARSPITSDGIELIKKCTSFYANERPSFKEIIYFIESKSFKIATEVDIEILRERFNDISRFI